MAGRRRIGNVCAATAAEADGIRRRLQTTLTLTVAVLFRFVPFPVHATLCQRSSPSRLLTVGNAGRGLT